MDGTMAASKNDPPDDRFTREPALARLQPAIRSATGSAPFLLE